MKENIYSVYVHIFPNKKRYVGITKNILSRRWGHGKNYKNQKLVYRAINKYGWDNIEHKVLYTNLSNSSRNKISKALKGNKNSLGVIRTEEYRKKLSESKKKKVMCIETNKTYNSLIEAGEQTKINYRNISSCCYGKRKTAGGFSWKYI